VTSPVSGLAGRRVLLTGGAGFIGSHIADALLASGAEVRVYDNLSSGTRENLSADVELVEGDILDGAALADAAAGCDAICHQAAQLEITKCIDDPIGDLRSNTEGTIHVLEAARRNDIERVIYASSACVYGQALQLPEPEGHRTAPNWAYGISKLAAEHYARLYTEMHGISTVGFRYSIVYGPREWYGRALTIFCRRALAGQAPVVFGEGGQLRDLVYVDDVVSANLRALARPANGADVFNVSTGRGTTIAEMAALVCRLAGNGLEPVHEQIGVGERSELADGRQRLPAELEAMVLDPAAAQAALDWAPLVGPEEGIARELEWVAANPHRWTEMHY
jgi:UDP-glucose 4-epimerase